MNSGNSVLIAAAAPASGTGSPVKGSVAAIAKTASGSEEQGATLNLAGMNISSLEELKAQLAGLVDPQQLAQWFPDGLENVDVEALEQLVASLPPFVQAAIQSVQDGKLLPLQAEAQAKPTVLPTEAAAASAAATSQAPVAIPQGVVDVAKELKAPAEKLDMAWGLNAQPPKAQAQAQAAAQATMELGDQRLNSLSAGELQQFLQASSAQDSGAEKTLATVSGVEARSGAAINQFSAQIRGAQATAPVYTSIAEPVGSSGWGDAVNDKVMWLSSQNIKTAHIRLDPPDLGPLEVKISLANEQTKVAFSSHHVQVRDALETQVARLREMFEEQGLGLVDVDVSGQQGGQDQLAGGEFSEGEGSAAGEQASVDGLEDDELLADSHVAQSIQGQGMVDYFA